MEEVALKLAAIVASHGDTPAVIDATGGLTFREFDRWTTALAHEIIAMAGEEGKVCLVVAGFDRRAITGMFGVLKTPHVLAALDRQIPPANLAEIAKELGAGSCLYTEDSEATVRAAGLDIPTLKIDTPPEGPVPPAPSLPDLNRPALLKRTSGSTGKAKTVAHLASAILLEAKLGAKVLHLQPGTRLSVISTFDAALTSAATLRVILGGTTLLPVDLRFETPKQATDRLIDAGLTHVYCTPTAMRVLCRGLPKGGIFPELRNILLGGEKTTMADVRLLAKSTPEDAKLRSTFASTETQLVGHTTINLADEVRLEDFSQMNLAEGVRIEILDEDGTPKPQGEIGRVRIVSPMIALGYLGDVDPDLAAKFQPVDAVNRSYLTDDLGYLTAEGRLVLTSRTGREVKIRARRVDLGELETWLTSQEGIREAAVVVQPLGPDGDPRLAAFVEGVPGVFEGTSALRAKMQDELIASMVPSVIVEVADLPRTPNQKIDRRALEADLSHLEAGDDEGFEPEGLMRQVAEIWTVVLERKPGSAEANFFNMGGDSISATVAAGLIEDEIGVPVDPGFVYRFPLLSDQTRTLERMGKSAVPLPDRLLVPLTTASASYVAKGDGPPRVFVISGAGGHVFPFAPLADELLPDWDMVGILHPGVLKGEQSCDSVEGYAERMMKAIKALQPAGPYYLLGYSFGGAVVHEIGARLAAAGQPTAVTILDLQLQKLQPLKTRARAAGRGLKTQLRQRLAGGDQPKSLRDRLGVLDDPDLDAAERARLAISFDIMDRIIESYRPPKSAAPSALIKSAASAEMFEADDYGWGSVAPLRRVVTAPGNHYNVFKGERLEGFAALLRDTLAELRRTIDPTDTRA